MPAPAAAAPPGERHGQSGRGAVRAAGAQAGAGLTVVLIAAAAATRAFDAAHLAHVVRWLFVLPASTAQALSAVLLVPRRTATARQVRGALVLNVAVGLAWLVLRTVADPTQPGGGPVAALSGRTQLLSACALAATALVLPRARWTVPTSHPGRRRLVAALSGTWLLALALSTSLFAVYVPNITMAGQSPVLAGRITPKAWPAGPRLDAVVGGHLLVVINASTAAFAVLSTALLGVLLHARLRATAGQVACRTGTPSGGALAAGLITAPGCCAVPLAAVLGPAALTAIAATTPYLMLAVVLVLAGDIVRTRRLLRQPSGRAHPVTGI